MNLLRTLPPICLGLALTAGIPSTSVAQDAQKKAATKTALPPATKSATEPAHRGETGFWADRHKLFLDRVKPGDAELLFIGDSITQGWEGAGKDVWKRFYGERHAVNLGIGGDRTQHVLWRLDHGEIDGIKPKAAVIMIGTNNMSTNSPEEIAEGVKLIVGRIQKKQPQTKILLLAIFPRAAKSDDPIRAKVKETNVLLSKLDDGKTVKFMDIGNNFLEADGSLAKEIMPDFLHLSPKGYRIWADAIEPTLWKMLND